MRDITPGVIVGIQGVHAMPLFEYQCTSCGHRFEALVIGSRQPDRCPQCDAPTIEKQFSTFGVGGTNGGYGTTSRLGSNCAPGGG